MTEDELRESIVEHGRSLQLRGLSPGSSGNLSARVDGGFLLTPTGASLGALDPARLSLLDGDGRHIGGDPPTKELWLHLAMYAERARRAGDRAPPLDATPSRPPASTASTSRTSCRR